jgi:hypothetical protein
VNGTLPVEALEEVYELLAEALDAVPEGEESVFLAKLALALGDRIGDVTAIREAIAVARGDQETE